MTDKIIVNSWNEWDPLKHVIVGKADGCCIPAPEPALDAKVPEDSDMKGQHGPRTKDTVDKANELLNNSFALSTVSFVLGPNWPLISESSGTFASNAGSGAGMQVPSALPTITCLRGSHSFQLLTIVLSFFIFMH